MNASICLLSCLIRNDDASREASVPATFWKRPVIAEQLKEANTMIERRLTRRSALGMIVAAAYGPFHLSGCGGSSSNTSGGGTTTPPPPSVSSRPLYHLAPATEWINDPQRPLWINNSWNLWVLWNADYPSGNGTAWRRYTSLDLVNWADQGISIPKYTTAYGDVWTGSTVVDTNNSAGYGASAVIALMTMPCTTLGGQGTGLWYSTNGGASFQFGAIVQTNPLAGNTTISDLVFRDPSVFWYAPTKSWVMSLAEIGKLSIYTSSDLTHWTFQSAMSRTDLGTMECPHLFQLHLYNADGTTTEDKWILLCGANGTSSGFTTGTAYWVGGFDGSAFMPDSTTPKWLDGGPDFYATTVFADASASDPLDYAFAIAWENNWDYAAEVPTVGYWGQLSIMRELKLQTVNGSSVLIHTPIVAQNTVFTATAQGTNQTISDSASYNWPSVSNGATCRIDFTLSPNNGAWPTSISLSVRGGDGYLTQIGFAPGAGSVSLNRAKSGPVVVADGVWEGTYKVICDFFGPVAVSVFIDTGSVEVFLNSGAAVMSCLITAPADATTLNLVASGGGAQVSQLIVRQAS
jgi:levanbiose-producing levanase